MFKQKNTNTSQFTYGNNSLKKPGKVKVHRHPVYQIGSALRLVGILTTLGGLLLIIPAGAFVVFFWPILLLPVLMLAVGHYMADNWKDK